MTAKIWRCNRPSMTAMDLPKADLRVKWLELGIPADDCIGLRMMYYDGLQV
jgi:hypothetical protein